VGEWADDFWIYDFKAGTRRTHNNPAQDICPCGDRTIASTFISDRDVRMNLFSIDLASKETKQLTNFKRFRHQISRPSEGLNCLRNKLLYSGATIFAPASRDRSIK